MKTIIRALSGALLSAVLLAVFVPSAAWTKAVGFVGLVTSDQISGEPKIASLASGTLALNTVTLATAGATDFDIPDACDVASGDWVTVVVQDASTVIEIGVLGAEDTMNVGGLGLDADDELDSPTSATTNEGSSITLTCLEANMWYSTAIVGTWADGGAAD